MSVIVPAHERWRLLERTLAALLHDAREAPFACEIIVVDNDSRPALASRARALARSGDALRVVRRIGLGTGRFAPGAARNVGIEAAAHECLVFLDDDCVPSPNLLARYYERVSAEPATVFIGHCIFIDTTGIEPAAVAVNRGVLEAAPRCASRSNYGAVEDRRLPELRELASQPRPYDCLFGSNFALHRDCLGDLRFDAAYDGYWGYEDIDLGVRLHHAGRGFCYVADAFVYHQEGDQLDGAKRDADRLRNISVLEERLPGFLAYRATRSRPGAAVSVSGRVEDGELGVEVADRSRPTTAD